MNTEAGSVQSLDASIQQTHEPLSGVVELLQGVTFGSDGLRYRRLDVQAQLHRFIEPVYFHAFVSDELVGVYVLDKRQLLVDGKRLNGYYRGALAVDEYWQGRGVGARMAQAAMLWLEGQAQGQTILSYGCIDTSNHRSLKLLKQLGARHGAVLSMYLMYRQLPSSRCTLTPMNSSLLQAASSLSDEVYNDCRVRDVSQSSLPGYAVLDDEGIVVSAGVVTTRFCIKEMGLVARLCTRLFVTPFPVARRRFNPHNFTYVSLSNVTLREGCENRWRDFVSAVLHELDCHFAVVYVDRQSLLFQRLQKANWFTRWAHSGAGSIQLMCSAFGPDKPAVLAACEADAKSHLWPLDA